MTSASSTRLTGPPSVRRPLTYSIAGSGCGSRMPSREPRRSPSSSTALARHRHQRGMRSSPGRLPRRCGERATTFSSIWTSWRIGAHHEIAPPTQRRVGCPHLSHPSRRSTRGSSTLMIGHQGCWTDSMGHALPLCAALRQGPMLTGHMMMTTLEMTTDHGGPHMASSSAGSKPSTSCAGPEARPVLERTADSDSTHGLCHHPGAGLRAGRMEPEVDNSGGTTTPPHAAVIRCEPRMLIGSVDAHAPGCERRYMAMMARWGPARGTLAWSSS